MGKKTLAIFLKHDDDLYEFSKVSYTTDGSSIITFPCLPAPSGIAHKLQIPKKPALKDELSPRLLSDSRFDANCNEKFRVSYHTTGQVNYHGSSLSSSYFEPLYNITKQNLFLIISFHQLCRFKVANPLQKSQNQPITVDISDLPDKRIDICFSIVPSSFIPINQNAFLIANAHVYNILFELFTDEGTYNFHEIYSPEDCVKIKPSNERPQSMPSESEAFIQFNHVLFQNDDLIMLAPNADKKVEIIFATVMRIPPWIKVEFQNPAYEIKCIEREDCRLFFKVFDREHTQFVSNPQDIKIIEYELDARIYDDNETPPIGFI